MSHKSGHIIIQRFKAPVFYGDTAPGTGAGKYIAKVKVWHVVVLAFLGGLPL